MIQRMGDDSMAWCGPDEEVIESKWSLRAIIMWHVSNRDELCCLCLANQPREARHGSVVGIYVIAAHLMEIEETKKVGLHRGVITIVVERQSVAVVMHLYKLRGGHVIEELISVL